MMALAVLVVALALIIAAAFVGDAVDEFAIDYAGAIGGVGLIGVDVHGEGELLADADDDVAEDGLPLRGADEDEDALVVADAELLGIRGGHVDVTLGDDDALLEVDLTAVFGILEGDGGAALDFAGLTDGGLDA